MPEGEVHIPTFYDSVRTLGQVEEVDYFVPGCPPRPEAIIYGVALALGLVDKKAAPVELKQMEFPIDMYTRKKDWEERTAIYKLLEE